MEKHEGLATEEHAFAAEGIPETGVKAGTVEDREAMYRLGKSQVFKRNFNFISIFGFAMMLLGTWETILGTVAFGLGNGGPSGLIYTYIGVWFGFILVIASMSEMASMAPTSGGQYHWVSEFCSRKYQKHISYLIGWLSVLGYQVGVTVTAFASGTIIQGLVVLTHPTYDYHRWHGTLIAMAITCVVAVFNIFCANMLPMIETIILFLHFAAWIAIAVVLWVLAPKTPNEQVWNGFVDAGWGSTGVSCLVGMITNVGSFIGGDAPVHMAEELKSASKLLPRAMMLNIIVNGAMGFVTLVTFCYTVGDLESALTTPTGYPIIQVFYNTTGSKAATCGLCALLIILNIVNNLTNMAGASRQMFAFARDRGMPFSPWIARVTPRYDIPVNAVIVSSLCACCLHCINIGSSIAFNIIMSIGSCALITSYMTSIGCVTVRRVRNLPLLPSHFYMGRWIGLVVNVLSLAFLVLIFVFAFFPPVPNPEAGGMNWAIAVYGGVLAVAGVYYAVRARKHYDGPVEYVRKSV